MDTLDSLIVKLGKLQDKKVVFVTGTFDILHVGHIKFLKEAKSKGDILVVGITSDNTVKRLKDSTRPIISEKERAKVLDAIKYVDYVFISSDKMKKSELILKIKPDIAVINLFGIADDLEEKIKAMTKKVKDLLPKIKFIFLKKDIGNSTTRIIEKIRSN